MSNSFRSLLDSERAILERLLQADFPGCGGIHEQVAHSSVREIDGNGSLEFQVNTSARAEVTYRVPVEGYFTDEDGVVIHVLLHVGDQKVRELEIYKEDSSQVIKMPPASELEVITLD